MFAQSPPHRSQYALVGKSPTHNSHTHCRRDPLSVTRLRSSSTCFSELNTKQTSRLLESCEKFGEKCVTVESGRFHSQPGVHCSFVPTGHTIDEGSHPSISRRFSARSRMIVVEFLPGAELQEVLESCAWLNIYRYYSSLLCLHPLLPRRRLAVHRIHWCNGCFYRCRWDLSLKSHYRASSFRLAPQFFPLIETGSALSDVIK